METGELAPVSFGPSQRDRPGSGQPSRVDQHESLHPFVTVSRAARLLNVSYPTARQTVAFLQGEGVLEEITGRAWGQLYLARPIVEVIEGLT